MTSHQQRNLDDQEIFSLTMLAIRHPEKDQSLLALYAKHYRHQPRDKSWHIDGGPPTAQVKDSGVRLHARLKFMVQKSPQLMVFEHAGRIEKAVVVGNTDHEWLLVVTGTLWRYAVDNSDNIKAESVAIPCYYNSHTRKGFGLVPLITSYEVCAVNIWDLHAE